MQRDSRAPAISSSLARFQAPRSAPLPLLIGRSRRGRLPGVRLLTACLLIGSLAALQLPTSAPGQQADAGENGAAGQASAAGSGQASAANSDQQGPLTVRGVYERTRTAETVEEFSQLVEDCRALAQTDLSPANAAYLDKLLAYVLNARGELYAGKASELLQAGDEKASAEMDALALADFEGAVQRDGQFHKAVHNRGVSYAVQGDYEKAIEDFTRTIELKSNYPNAWFNRAEIRYELGRYEEALRDYDRFLQMKPDDAGAHTSRGHTYFQLGRYDRALGDYGEAVRLDPDNAVAYADRGDAYRSLGRWQQANSDYREALRRDGQSSRIYQSAAWFLATCPDSRYRNDETALQAAQRALQLGDETDYRLLDTLAAAQASAGRFEEARKTQQEAIQRAPEDEQDVLKRRLALYEASRPYRQQPATR